MNSEPSINYLSQYEQITPAQIVEHLKFSCQMPNIIKGMLDRQIIQQKAVEENIIIEEQELQQAADRFRYENNLMSSQDTLQWLEKHSLSVTEFEELIKSNTVAQKLAQHLFSDRVEAYFYAHQLDYTKAIVYEIALSEHNLAMELFYGIQEQEFSFWELAHQYIQDEELRRLGGYKGRVTRNQLKPEISAAVFAVENPPQILKPISVGKYSYLIYVEEIIQPVLEQSLRYEIIHQLFKNWLDGQRSPKEV